MPESPATLPADLIAEVGRFNAVREVLRLMLLEPVRTWHRGAVLAVRVLFA